MKGWQKLAAWALGLGFVYFLVTNPTGAAHFTTSLLNALKGVGNSLSTFFSSL